MTSLEENMVFFVCKSIIYPSDTIYNIISPWWGCEPGYLVLWFAPNQNSTCWYINKSYPHTHKNVWCEMTIKGKPFSCRDIEMLSALVPLWGQSIIHSGFPSQRDSNMLLCFLYCQPEQAVEYIVELPVIWDSIVLMWWIRDRFPVDWLTD